MKRGLSPAVPTARLKDGGTWGYLQAGYLHCDGFWWTKINPMRRRQQHHPWHHSGRFASGPPGLTHLTSLHFHAGKPKERGEKTCTQRTCPSHSAGCLTQGQSWDLRRVFWVCLFLNLWGGGIVYAKVQNKSRHRFCMGMLV